MREIKFRAWDKKRNIMIWLDYSDNRWEGKEERRANEAYMELTWITSICKDDRFEVMQYVWLKDKNWKEIYEWDILTWRNMGILKYYKGRYEVEWKYTVRPLTGIDINESDWEVVWNIYDNPDLIKD